MDRHNDQQERPEAGRAETVRQTPDEDLETDSPPSFETQIRHVINQLKQPTPTTRSLRLLGYQLPELQERFVSNRFSRYDRSGSARDVDLADIIQKSREAPIEFWRTSRRENRTRRTLAGKLPADRDRDRQTIVFVTEHATDSEAGTEQEVP